LTVIGSPLSGDNRWVILFFALRIAAAFIKKAGKFEGRDTTEKGRTSQYDH